MGNDIVIAVDVAKSVFEVGVSDRPGHICRRERPRRDQFLSFFLAYPGATVVMGPAAPPTIGAASSRSAATGSCSSPRTTCVPT